MVCVLVVGVVQVWRHAGSVPGGAAGAQASASVLLSPSLCSRSPSSTLYQPGPRIRYPNPKLSESVKGRLSVSSGDHLLNSDSISLFVQQPLLLSVNSEEAGKHESRRELGSRPVLMVTGLGAPSLAGHHGSCEPPTTPPALLSTADTLPSPVAAATATAAAGAGERLERKRASRRSSFGGMIKGLARSLRPSKSSRTLGVDRNLPSLSGRLDCDFGREASVTSQHEALVSSSFTSLLHNPPASAAPALSTPATGDIMSAPASSTSCVGAAAAAAAAPTSVGSPQGSGSHGWRLFKKHPSSSSQAARQPHLGMAQGDIASPRSCPLVNSAAASSSGSLALPLEACHALTSNDSTLPNSGPLQGDAQQRQQHQQHSWQLHGQQQQRGAEAAAGVKARVTRFTAQPAPTVPFITHVQPLCLPPPSPAVGGPGGGGTPVLTITLTVGLPRAPRMNESEKASTKATAFHLAPVKESEAGGADASSVAGWQQDGQGDWGQGGNREQGQGQGHREEKEEAQGGSAPDSCIPDLNVYVRCRGEYLEVVSIERLPNQACQAPGAQVASLSTTSDLDLEQARYRVSFRPPASGPGLVYVECGPFDKRHPGYGLLSNAVPVIIAPDADTATEVDSLAGGTQGAVLTSAALRAAVVAAQPANMVVKPSSSMQPQATADAHAVEGKGGVGVYTKEAEGGLRSKEGGGGAGAGVGADGGEGASVRGGGGVGEEADACVVEMLGLVRDLGRLLDWGVTAAGPKSFTPSLFTPCSADELPGGPTSASALPNRALSGTLLFRLGTTTLTDCGSVGGTGRCAEGGNDGAWWEADAMRPSWAGATAGHPQPVGSVRVVEVEHPVAKPPAEGEVVEVAARLACFAADRGWMSLLRVVVQGACCSCGVDGARLADRAAAINGGWGLEHLALMSRTTHLLTFLTWWALAAVPDVTLPGCGTHCLQCKAMCAEH